MKFRNTVLKKRFSEKPSKNKKLKQQEKRQEGCSYIHEEEKEYSICPPWYKTFRNSKLEDDWIQCTTCNRWAHEKCVTFHTVFYVCIHCWWWERFSMKAKVKLNKIFIFPLHLLYIKLKLDLIFHVFFHFRQQYSENQIGLE